jgi:hypothetical protein
VQDRTRLGRARRGRRGRVRGDRQEQLDGVPAAIGGDEAGESVRVMAGIGGRLSSTISGASQSASLSIASPFLAGLEAQARAGGHPDHARRSARLGEDGVEVLDLPLDRVGRRVATLAAG